MPNPVVEAISPTVGQEWVDPNVAIRIRVPTTVVDPWTVEVKRAPEESFELALTYSAGATFEDGYAGERSAVEIGTDLFDVTIDPVVPFDLLTVVEVRITGEDGGGNPVVVI